jgi:hypothetical protein
MSSTSATDVRINFRIRLRSNKDLDVFFVFSCQAFEAFGSYLLEGDNLRDDRLRFNPRDIYLGNRQRQIDGVRADHGGLPGHKAEHMHRDPLGKDPLDNYRASVADRG